MKRVHPHYVGMNERLVRHEEGAIRQLEGTERVLIVRRWPLAVGRWPIFVRFFLDDVNIHLLEERRVAVRQTHLQILGFVDVLVDCPWRRVPDVVSLELDALAVDDRCSAPADAEVHQGDVVANRTGALAGKEHRQRDRRSRRQSVAHAGSGIDDVRCPAAVEGRWKGSEPFDLLLDLFASDDDRRCRPMLRFGRAGPIDECVLFSRCGCGTGAQTRPRFLRMLQPRSKPALVGQANQLGTDGEIGDTHPKRLEHGDLLRIPSRQSHGRRQRLNPAPRRLVVAEDIDQLACELARLWHAVRHDAVASGDQIAR